MSERRMEVFFPGGKRVYARYGDFVIETDQPVSSGGEGTAPAPFLLFLASLATCAGIYVLAFLQKRGIPTEDARLYASFARDPETGALTEYEVEIVLPPGFPAKYRDAIVRAAELCAVKKVMENPPRFVVRTRMADE